MSFFNTATYDGSWSLSDLKEGPLSKCFLPEDRERLDDVFSEKDTQTKMQLQMLLSGQEDYRWMLIKTRAILEDETKQRCFVGFIRDIHDTKIMELERESQLTQDPVTNLYRLKSGLDIIHSMRKKQPEGILILTDIAHFKEINAANGLNLGDLLLEEFAEYLREIFCGVYPECVLIRAGSDEFLIWVAGGEIERCQTLFEQLQVRFSGLVRQEVMELTFHAGLTKVYDDQPICNLIKQVKGAKREAQRLDTESVVWNPDIEPGDGSLMR